MICQLIRLEFLVVLESQSLLIYLFHRDLLSHLLCLVVQTLLVDLFIQEHLGDPEAPFNRQVR